MTTEFGGLVRPVMAALLMVGTASIAQAAEVPLPAGPVMAFDIAGVRLGMSAAAAKAALQRAGYRVAPIQSYSNSWSFEQTVRQEADRRLGRPPQSPAKVLPSGYDAVGPNRETVHVDMLQAPGGPIVSKVTFQVPQEAMTRDAFKAQVLAKYGAPRRIVMGDEGTWCSPEAAAFCGQLLAANGHYDTDYPRLTTSLTGRSLGLSIGEDEFRRVDRAKEAAVVELAPKTSRAAF